MKKHLLKFLLTFFVSLFLSVGWVNAQTPIITAIADCDAAGGTPKVLEIYADGAVNFTLYSLQNQTNANTTWGATQDLSSFGTVTDAFVYVYYDGTYDNISTEFTSASTLLESSTMNLNGDDRVRIILTADETVIDQYGVTDTDGSGQTWEWMDSYAKRVDGTVPDGGFTEENWSFAGVSALDGEGLDQSGTAFETAMGGIGTYLVSAGDTPPQATFSPANGASDVLIGSDITITFNELIYQSDGSTEIIDADLPALITITEGGVAVADGNFTMTYDNSGPYVITINPNSDLSYDEDYNIAFGSVYDNAAQENTGENATFHTELGYIPMVSAYSVSSDSIVVTYESSMTAVDPADYNLTGTAAITFSKAVIDGTDDKIVHLKANATVTGDATLDNIADANSGVDFYAGITPIAYTNTTNPGGTISTGINATFHGIVSANDAFNGVWVADAEGAYNGILVYNSSFDALVAVGDEILFTATLTAYNNLTELINPSLIETVLFGQTPYGPSVINGSDIEETIAADTDPAETWEGQLINIVNAEITVDLDGTSSFYKATDDDGTTTFRIGDNVNYQLSGIPLTVGDNVTITGVGDYEDGAYRINPRNVSDIVSATDTVGSTVYTVDQGGLTITDIPYSATLAAFEANIEAADTATFDTYLADGVTAATVDLQTGYKVIVTAADGITKATYTITKNAVLTDATVTSGVYTVDDGLETISNIPNGTDLATFVSNITAPTYGSFAVFQSDGTTPAIDLATGYKLIATAEDETTTKTYVITVSDIVADTDSEVAEPTTQVATATIAVVDGDTEGEAFDVFSFDINDAGTADGIETKVSQIVLFYGPNMTLDLNTDDLADGWFEIDGTKVNFTGEPIVGADSIAFAFGEGEITVPDGGSVNAVLKVYLNANASDGKVVQFMIDADQHGFETTGISSEFSTTLTGGDIVGNDITIDVVATELNFSVEPSNVYVDAAIDPAVVVEAVDANGNIDIDYTTSVSITATGATLVGTPVAGTPVAGLATFDALSFSDEGTGVILTAASGTLTNGTSATFDVTVEPETDLFFSEYIEGSSSNRAIEIYNPTGAIVDLSAYTVKQSHNGTGWGVDGIAYVLPLTGDLAINDVYVIAHADFDEAKDVADLILAYSEDQGAKIPSFTGNDALGLFKNDVLIDVIGNELEDSVWSVAGIDYATQNHTLIRKSSTIIGNTNWTLSAGTNATDSEWELNDLDYFDDLGSFGPKSGTDILTFDFVGQTTGAATIDDIEHTVDIEVRLGTSPTALVATFTLSSGASAKVGAVDQISGTTANDFSSPVTYSVTAEDGTPQDWTVTVTVSTTQSDAKEITAFTVEGIVGTAAIESGAATVNATVEYGTDITSLKPVFEISPLATIADTATARDFTNAQTYVVTAEDGTPKNWVVTITEEEVSEVTIYDIQYTTDASGNSPYLGELISTSGIVTAIDPDRSLWIQDGTGAWNGVYIYSSTTASAVSVGDNIEFVAEVDEFNNLTELKNVVNLNVISSGNTLPAVTEITTIQANLEDYEGVLVKISNATCTNDNADYGMFEVNDGSGAIKIDDDIFAFTPTLDINYDITGLGHYSFSESKILPRSADDIQISVGINNPDGVVSMNIFPNPNNGLFTLEINNTNNEEFFVEVYDVIGKMVYNTKISDNITNINLTEMSSGIYYVSIKNGNNRKVSKILIQ